jgi:hypothetical protein
VYPAGGGGHSDSQQRGSFVQKFLIGCLVFLVLGAAALGVGAYFVYRAATPMIENARNAFEGFAKFNELEREIKNRSSYAAPPTGELAPEQVARFVRVQEYTRRALGQRIDEIEQKYEYLKKTTDASRQPSFTELMSSLRDMIGLFTDARRAQVDALNQEGFSSDEYSWVRARVYQAAGVELAGSIDFQRIADAAREGTGIDAIRVPDKPIADIPAKNRELVKPHMQRMDEWLPLAFFGL